MKVDNKLNTKATKKQQALWIKNPLAIYVGNKSAELATAGLVIKNDKIIELVAKGNKPCTKVINTYDASDSIVLPGFVNTHHHFYQTLTRAYPYALNKSLFSWLTSLYPVWENIEPYMLALATKVALAELLLSGCTTTSDHHYLFTEKLRDAIDIQLSQAKDINMRVVLTRGSMSLGQKQGGLPPDNVVQKEQTIIDDCIRLIRKYHKKEDGAMVQIALAPCSPFSVSRELMQESARLAKSYKVRLHTHLAETIDEQDFCVNRFNLRTVDYLEKVGWLKDNVWLAHGIHFNNEEIKKLGKAGVGICHCPNSNMLLASGICKTIALEKAGCIIGLGVDGSASNDSSNMMAEVRQALYLQKLKYGANNITHHKVLYWATKGGAKLLGRDDIGEIAVGKQADLALFRLDEVGFSGYHDPLAALFLCGTQKPHRVMVAGKWSVIDSRLVGIDTKALMKQHSQAAKHLYRLAN